MAILRASDFFRTHDEGVLLNEMKTYSSNGRHDFLQEAIDRFREQADIAIEVRHRTCSIDVYSIVLF
jgi:hypothetical protein